MNHVEMVINEQDDEHFRRMASTLVDNLLAKAIVKASQKLAFNTNTNDNADITNHHHHHHLNNNHPNCDHPSCNDCGGYIQTKRKVSDPVRLKDLPSTDPSSSSSQSHSSTNTTARTSSSTPPIPSTVASNTASPGVDINGNAPEIQIDLVGPRTPSPVEESSFELPPIERKQYKFKVQTNETNQRSDTGNRSNNDDKNYIETNIDDVDNNSDENMYYCTTANSQDNNNKSITIKSNLKNQYNGDKPVCLNHPHDNNKRGREHDQMDPNNKDEDETNQQQATISNNNNKNGKKQSKSIQIVEMAFDESTSQVDVATTPELEIDLEQAQELSKHIVSDIINQAVKRLNDDIKNNKRLKHEPESISKISCYSSRSMVQNNCSWLTRTRHAIRRIVRHACICARSKEDALNDQLNLNDANNSNNNGGNSGNHPQQQHRQHQSWNH